MKKKLLAVLAAFVAVTPLAGVNAEIQYTLGSEHNFIVNAQQKADHEDMTKSQADRESVGVKVVALGEKTEDGYVKALATGAWSWIYSYPADPAALDEITSYKDLRNYMHMYDDLNANTGVDYTKFEATKDIKKEDHIPDFSLTADYVKNYNTDDKWVDIMSAKDFLTWMKGAETTPASGSTYSLTEEELKTFNTWFFYPVTFGVGVIPNAKGLYTKDYDKTTGKIWVVDVTMNDAGTAASAAVLREKSVSDFSAVFTEDGYITVPILYFNETYNCKYEVVEKNACYKCDNEYQWLVVGTQASTCEAVSGVTTKAKCVAPSKTGVEDYILEFAIAAGICGLVLVAVKRKSLFSRV